MPVSKYLPQPVPPFNSIHNSPLNLYKAHNKVEKHGIMRRFMTRKIDRATRMEHIG